MIDATGIETGFSPATDGDIAVINLESARQQSWSRFWSMPERPGTAELIVEQEQLTAQFVGDLTAFDRLDVLINELTRVEPKAARTALIAAQVASATHRFAEARAYLAQAVARGAAADAAERLALGIDQATGANLTAILEVRRVRATRPGYWEELVPLGALLADLGEFEESEQTYHRALREYPDVSPFGLAWVCFQLGMLWGECVNAPKPDLAAQWYRAAIDYLPCYVKARVHLAEIYLDQGQFENAHALLTPALASADPEVHWRLADVAEVSGDPAEAEMQLRAARTGFEALVAKHPLAFVDHVSEFYLGSGADPERAFEMAQLNYANRQTLRAFEQTHATALAAGATQFAARLIADANGRYGRARNHAIHTQPKEQAHAGA